MQKEKRSFTKDQLEELKSHVPIEIVGESNVQEKKAQMFDLITGFQADYFLIFKQEQIMGSEKLEISLADTNQLLGDWKSLYAIIPVDPEVVLKLILQM